MRIEYSSKMFRNESFHSESKLVSFVIRKLAIFTAERNLARVKFFETAWDILSRRHRYLTLLKLSIFSLVSIWTVKFWDQRIFDHGEFKKLNWLMIFYIFASENMNSIYRLSNMK